MACDRGGETKAEKTESSRVDMADLEKRRGSIVALRDPPVFNAGQVEDLHTSDRAVASSWATSPRRSQENF